MCIIIYKPAGIALFPKTVENSFNHNSDGAGFSYLEEGVLHTQTGFFKLKKFLDAYEPHKEKQMLLHFRIRTHGTRSEKNCQPLVVKEDMVFAHNGIIYRVPNHEKKSDTVIFQETILTKLIERYGQDAIFEPTLKRLIEVYIGESSKLVFLKADGSHHIFNSLLGEWVNGCWFSNDSWKDRVYVAPPPIYQGNDARSHYSNTQPEILSPETTSSLPFTQERLAISGPKEIKNWVCDECNNRYHTERECVNHGMEIHGLHDVEAYENAKFDPGRHRQPVEQILPLKINSYARLIAQHAGGEKGWLGKIMAFYENHTVEMYFPVHKRTMRIPIICIEPVSVRVIPPSHQENKP